MNEIGFHARPKEKTPTERLEAMARKRKEKLEQDAISAVGGTLVDEREQYYGHGYDWKKKEE